MRELSVRFGAIALLLAAILALTVSSTVQSGATTVAKPGGNFSMVKEVSSLGRREAAQSCCDVEGRQYCPCRSAFQQGKVPEGGTACCIIKGRQYCPCRSAWDRILPPWE